MLMITGKAIAVKTATTGVVGTADLRAFPAES